ncbi:hypothetical protein ACROYT_G023837 [Oculina patagonica]
MALKVFVALLVLSVVLEFSGLCQGQYRCIFTTCKREELEDPKASLPEGDLVPLNEYRRNKLMRLSDMLRNKRNRLELNDDVEEN